jgi:hypothetical protein
MTSRTYYIFRKISADKKNLSAASNSKFSIVIHFFEIPNGKNKLRSINIIFKTLKNKPYRAQYRAVLLLEYRLQ